MMLAENLRKMVSLQTGPDVIILSVTSLAEEEYWIRRLDGMRGKVIPENAVVFTVHENWKAGNALGTLHAFSEARKKAERQGFDLMKRMEKGDSVFIYHTAGKGSRLYPLTAAEHNNKSRIRLAGSFFRDHTKEAISLLEGIIKQTSVFAPVRKGRLSVFWGDQIFIPSRELQETPFAIDLLIKLLPKIPDRDFWEKNEYHKYGIVLRNEKGDLKQLEKLSYPEFIGLPLEPGERVGLSLGCFSLTVSVLRGLLEEFDKELRQKKVSMDTDPHWWMPLSLEETVYFRLVRKADTACRQHYERMQCFKEKYLLSSGCQRLFGGSDMGTEGYWWDYGNCQAYFRNCLKILRDDAEGEALRSFFSLPDVSETSSEGLRIENSRLIHCQIQKGFIKDSVLVNVTGKEVYLDRSVAVNVSAPVISGEESLFYNVADEGAVRLREKEIRADTFSKEFGHITLKGHLEKSLPWEAKYDQNPLAFEQVYQLNKEADPEEGEEIGRQKHQKVLSRLSGER